MKQIPWVEYVGPGKAPRYHWTIEKAQTISGRLELHSRKESTRLAKVTSHSTAICRYERAKRTDTTSTGKWELIDKVLLAHHAAAMRLHLHSAIGALGTIIYADRHR